MIKASAPAMSCENYFFAVAAFFAAGLALAGKAAAARLALAAVVAAKTVFFAVSALRLARVLLDFAVVFLLLVFPLRRDALFVVMYSRDFAQNRRGVHIVRRSSNSLYAREIRHSEIQPHHRPIRVDPAQGKIRGDLQDDTGGVTDNAT